MYLPSRKKTDGRLLARASTAALIAGSCFATGAFAQDDEIIVTGSRIPQANAISASPVTTIGNVEFDIRGTTRVEDLTNTLPQVFAAQGANTSNGATGTAQVSLRGLGANRTLVLVNGHRLQYGSAISSAPDLNQIPGALVERVEVLTGGASAAYGSDAIAGVVNFLMIQDFEGVRIDGQLSGYQHGNNNSQAQDVLTRAQATGGAFGSDLGIPESSVFDGKGQDITLTIGANTEDGRGNVTMYAGYRNNDAILQADRDFSKCAYGGGDPEFVCVGSSATPNGTFATSFGTFTLDEATGNTFRPTDVFVNPTSPDTFNYAPTNFYQRPDERFTLGAFAHYEVNENLEFYSETMFYDYRSDAQIAFTGTFFTTSFVNCDNPLIPAGELPLICTPAQVAAGDDAIFYINKRFIEGNPRSDSIRLTSYRMLGGLRGQAVEGWDYDVYFQYANTHNSQTYNNDAVIPNIQNALFAEDDGAGGVQCRDSAARAAGCVPLNIFVQGGVTQAQLDYIMQRSFQDGNTKQYLAEGVLTGDLGVYGMKSPWAEDGIGIALGMQWRKDKLEYRPDGLFEFGLLSGQGGPTPPTRGEIETTDFFAEAQIPLVTGMAFAESLTFHGGYRHSDVSTSGSYSTWKLAGDWQIVPEVRVRGGWQRAARAANVIESFTPQSIGLSTLPRLPNGQSDPCAGPTPFRSLADCAFTGVTAGQYGSISSNPARQYNGLFGGNSDLTPEVSDTYTVGVVLTPNDYVPGNLLFSVDYFDITVDGFISAISLQTTLNQCLDTHLASVTTATGAVVEICDAIHRDGAGTLWRNSSGFVEAVNLNTGSLSTSGLDVNLNWGVDFEELGLGNAGGLEVDLVGTYLIDLETEELPGALIPIYDCAGFYAGRCGGPNPEWRHKLRTTWQSPLGVDATVTWRYFSSVDDGDSVSGITVTDTDLSRTLGSRNYIDLQASYNVTENWNVRVGVNNLLDKDPPLTTETSGFQNGNTYPQTYDAQGRFLFIGTTIDF
jgi:outer membrane receptor protein involved in Fe transport